MRNAKTAISLDASLLKAIDDLARELALPRSQIFVRAAEDFLQQHRNRQLLYRINLAYEPKPDGSEKKQLRQMRLKQRRRLEGEW